MTSTKSAEAVSPLRRRMIEDMSVRKFGDKTRHDYIRHVESLAEFLGRSPYTATGEDLRRYQVHQTESGVHPPAMNGSVAALRFFFKTTLGRAELATRLARIRYPRRLPRVLSPEDVGFAVRHPRWEPCAGIPLARIWAGAISSDRPLYVNYALVLIVLSVSFS
jgi:integrase/recombinase XerD